MKRKQIYLSEEMDRKLKQISHQRGIPQAEVIREGLEAYLTHTDKNEQLWSQLLDQMKKSPLKNIDWDREKIHTRGEKHERTD